MDNKEHNLRSKSSKHHGGVHKPYTHPSSSKKKKDIKRHNDNRFATLATLNTNPTNDDTRPTNWDDTQDVTTQAWVNPTPSVVPTSSSVKKLKLVKSPPSASSSSENPNMDVDPPESTADPKGKQSIEPPVNISNPCNLTVERPTEFAIFADLRSTPGASHDEKRQLLDHRFLRNRHYMGSRIMNFRGRKIIKLYFDDERAANEACTPTTSIHDTDPLLKVAFVRFDKDVINQDIQQSRKLEANRTLKATNLPPELDSQTLRSLFSEFGELERYRIVRQGRYNTGFFVYKDPSATLTFKTKWFMFLKKETVRITPLNLTEDESRLRNQYILKVSGLPLYCYSRDLWGLAGKLNACCVHVPRKDGLPLPDTTGYLYFDNASDWQKAKESNLNLSYQSRALYLSGMTSQVCFACGNPAHECKTCSLQILRYRSRNPAQQRLSRKTTLVKPSGSAGSYASAVKGPTVSHAERPSEISLQHVLDKINLIFDEIKLLKADVASLKKRDETKITFDDSVTYVEMLKKDLPEDIREPTVEFVCNNFDGLIAGVSLLNKELSSLKSDINLLKDHLPDPTLR